MMKQPILVIYTTVAASLVRAAALTALLLAWMLPACTDDSEAPLEPAPPLAGTPLRISVTDGGYASALPGTKAIDEGYATHFVAGDTIGLYVMTQKSGTNWRLQRNVAIAFNGTEWIFPPSPVVTYEPPNDSIEKYYFAYYPYNRFEGLQYSVNCTASAREFFANGIAQWQPAADQSTPSAYTASDLMIAKGEVTPRTDGDGYVLSFRMEHQMALAVVSVPRTEYTYTASDGTARNYQQYTGLAPDGGAFLPDSPSTGRYLALPGQTYNATYYDSDFKKRTFSIVTSAGDAGKYVRHVVDNADGPVTPTNRDLYIGDLYMHDGSILPYQLIDGRNFTFAQDLCLGLICSTADPTTVDPLLRSKHPTCNHATVIALKDVAGTAWSQANEKVNDWTNSTDRGDNQVNIGDTSSERGYSNTYALRLYNEAHPDKEVLPVSAIDTYTPAAPPGSSGWYWPSKDELFKLIQPIDALFLKAGGTPISSPASYWTSVEFDAENSYSIKFDGYAPTISSADEKSKKTEYYLLRPFLAF